jgi:hypothetical protein
MRSDVVTEVNFSAYISMCKSQILVNSEIYDLCDVFFMQLFSMSVVCGLKLYKDHVAGLKDADATITFTQQMNDIFDLLNSRRPVEAIRIHSERDKLKVICYMFDVQRASLTVCAGTRFP